MKRLLLLFILLLYSTASFAQRFTLANAKMNIFYGGIPNPINITVNGISNSSLLLTTENGKITRGHGSNSILSDFTYTPERLGETIIYIKSKKGKTFKTIDSFYSRVLKVPKPEAHFSNVGSITHSKGIIVILKDFDFDVRFTVNLYRFTLVHNDSTIYSGTYIGSEFTDRTKSFLREVKIGDKIIIDNIQVIGPLNQRYDLDEIVYTVTEQSFNNFRY